MASLDLRTTFLIVNPAKDRITCVGEKKRKKEDPRCGQFFMSRADICEAEEILADLSTCYQSLSDLELSLCLFEVAELLLCPQHRGKPLQAKTVVNRWYQALEKLQASNAERQELTQKIEALLETKRKNQQRIAQVQNELQAQKNEYETRIQQSEARHRETRTNLEQENRNITDALTATITQLQNDRELDKQKHDLEKHDSILESTLTLREDSQREIEVLESVQNNDSHKWTCTMSTRFEISRESPYLTASISSPSKPQTPDLTEASISSYSPHSSLGTGDSTPPSIMSFENTTSFSVGGSPINFRSRVSNGISRVSEGVSHVKTKLGRMRSRTEATTDETIVSTDELV